MSIVADWHIGVLKEKHGTAIEVPISFIKCERKKSISYYYGENWSVISSFASVDYDLFPVTEDGEYDYENGIFDLSVVRNRYKILSERISVCEMERLLCTFINSSPIKTIYWLTRIDNSKDNSIEGTISLKNFLRRYNQGTLEFNKAYLVKK